MSNVLQTLSVYFTKAVLSQGGLMNKKRRLQSSFLQFFNLYCIFSDRKWLEEKKMGCFLGVAQGSAEPPLLVELKYTGSSNKTVAVVGKG